MTSVLKASSLAQKKYEHLPPKNPEVAAIMAEHGVGRKRAYDILRARKEAQYKSVEVPQTQRVQVLKTIVDHGGASKNALVLLDDLHTDGVKIDMHDVVKTLWALQKTNFVMFRERNNPPGLYAIKLTDQGFAAYADLKTTLAEEQLEKEREFQASEHGDGYMAEVTTINPGTPEWDKSEKALEKQRLAEYANLNTIMEGKAPVVDLGKPVPTVDLTSLPLMRSIRERARKEAVLAKAAALLEEAGEEDMALSVMARTEFTPLELEVKTLLASIGEI